MDRRGARRGGRRGRHAAGGAGDGTALRGEAGDPHGREIARAVQDALLFDPRVGISDLGVTVEDGVVTLGGVVDTPEAKQAAEADARKTEGVVAVRNELLVRWPGSVPDAESAREGEAASVVVSFGSRRGARVGSGTPPARVGAESR